MLVVKTRVAQSKIHGIGLFADQDISKGTKVWGFTPGFDCFFPATVFKALPEVQRNFLRGYAYKDRCGCWILTVDNDRFINSSSNPNVVEGETGLITLDMVAARDITRGEELTCAYSSFDLDHEFKLSH